MEGYLMFPFPFWYNSCCGGDEPSRRSQLQQKLKFLKAMRDDLETKVAGLNAAISSVEQQLTRDDVTQV